jgi:hypothetical protein
MNKIITWILGFTKFGKLNDALKGYRAAAVSLATALAGTAAIIVKLTEQGLPYLATVATTTEFQTAAGGWTAFFLALKGMRIEEKMVEKPQ